MKFIHNFWKTEDLPFVLIIMMALNTLWPTIYPLHARSFSRVNCLPHPNVAVYILTNAKVTAE